MRINQDRESEALEMAPMKLKDFQVSGFSVQVSDFFPETRNQTPETMFPIQLTEAVKGLNSCSLNQSG